MSLQPFFENKKKYSYFRKTSPDCVHLWIKFSIQNVVLGVSKRKNSKKMFPSETFFSCVFDEMLIEVPQFQETYPTLKITGNASALRHYSFLKTHHPKCLIVFRRRLCLHNCSVIWTVTLCYVLYQTHLEFWYIHNFSIF